MNNCAEVINKVLKGTLSCPENFWYVKTACFCIPNIYFLFWNSPRNTPKIRKNCQFLSRKVTKMASMAPKKSINSCQWLQNLEKIDVNDSANLEKNRVNDSRNWNKTVSTAPKSGKKMTSTAPRITLSRNFFFCETIDMKKEEFRWGRMQLWD